MIFVKKLIKNKVKTDTFLNFVVLKMFLNKL